MAVNNKAYLVTGIIALSAVTLSAIGWTIRGNTVRAEGNSRKIESHEKDPDAHPVIQGKIEVINTKLGYIQEAVKDNSEKLDDVKKLIEKKLH